MEMEDKMLKNDKIIRNIPKISEGDEDALAKMNGSKLCSPSHSTSEEPKAQSESPEIEKKEVNNENDGVSGCCGRLEFKDEISKRRYLQGYIDKINKAYLNLGVVYQPSCEFCGSSFDIKTCRIAANDNLMFNNKNRIILCQECIDNKVDIRSKDRFVERIEELKVLSQVSVDYSDVDELKKILVNIRLNK